MVAWRQLGELCSRYLAKGRKVAVSGSIQTRTYEAQDGGKRVAIDIVADEVEFLSKIGDAQEAEYLKQEREAIQNEPKDIVFTEVDDDGDLPF